MNELSGPSGRDRLLPCTPRKDKGRKIESKIQSISREFDLPLSVDTKLLTPRQRKEVLDPTVNTCIDYIRFLFWKNETALEDVLEQLREDSKERLVRCSTLAHLVDLLADPVKLTKERPSDFKLEKSSSVKPARSIDKECLGRPSLTSTAKLSRKLPSTTSSHVKTPISLRQTKIPWTSSKLNENRAQKLLATSDSPSLDRKRPSDEDLPKSVKQARKSSDARPGAQHSDPTTSLRVSFAASVDTSTVPSARTSFASTVSETRSFASTVATTVSSDDEEYFNSSSSDYLQDDQLWASFDQPVRTISFGQNSRSPAVDHSLAPISLSQQTTVDAAFGARRTLHRMDSGTANVEDQLPKGYPLQLEDKVDAGVTPVGMTVAHQSSPTLARGTSVGSRRSTRKSAGNTGTVLENHLVRDLPKHGLTPESTPESWLAFPFCLRWECFRAAQALGISLAELAQSSFHDEESLYRTVQHAANESIRHFNRTSSVVWDASRDAERSKTITYKGKLVYNTGRNRQRLFDLQLQPLLQDNRNSRLQRFFGAHRFLYIDITDVQDEMRKMPTLSSRLLELLGAEMELLGCSWRSFHIEALSTSNKRSSIEDKGGYRIVLFATKGPGLQPISVKQLLDWIIPLKKNEEEGFCKAFARLDLSLSRTTPTVTFKPSQVKFVDDTKADWEDECVAFNDPDLHFPYHPGMDFPGKSHVPPVMNDGCSLISVGAAKEICQTAKLTGTRPATFQGRINGCKGMWTINAPYDSTDPDDQAIWIEITKTQRKVRPSDNDLDESQCHETRWTFDLVKYSKSPCASNLYLEFMPILEDRHVSRDVLCNIVKKRLELDFDKLYNSLDDPTSLRRWIHSQNSAFEETARDVGISWNASEPEEIIEKIIVLLESGFEPRKCRQLANEFKSYAQMWTSKLRRRLNIRLPKSTSVFGIADPTGTLKPGEVHLGFSETFHDETNGEAWQYLQGEVLVARHPTLRRSDIQKVMAVYRQELRHLKDVVVFPASGCFPMAGKLQGGDYDGDTFWITWEGEITDPFLNAPAPTSSPPPEKFSIDVNKRKLKEVLGEGCDVDAWLQQSFAFKLQDDLLGQVTNFYKRLTYKENSIGGSNVNDVIDLHDLIIDAPKNGYAFTPEAFHRFKKERKIEEPPSPAWEELLSSYKKGVAKSGRVSVSKYNPANIVDKVLFEIVNPKLEAMRVKLEELLKDADSNDSDLAQLYLDQQTRDDDPVIKEVLSSLIKDFAAITTCWKSTFHPGTDFARDGEKLSACEAKCHAIYRSISPSRTDSPIVTAWLKPRLPHEPRTWDLLKASAFYYDRHMRRGSHYTRSRDPPPQLVFLVAGRELCYLKAMSKPETRVLAWDMYAMLKPRKEKQSLTQQTQHKRKKMSEVGIGRQGDEDESRDDDTGLLGEESESSECDEFFSPIG